MGDIKIITLCGSTKFKKEFEKVNKELSLKGNIVISVGVFSHADNIKLSSKVKAMLDNIHKRKIDLSDEIFVINKNGYIGEGTFKEIVYATQNNKTIRYLE